MPGKESVKVFVRFRPLNRLEREEYHESEATMVVKYKDKQNIDILDWSKAASYGGKPFPTPFAFDRIFNGQTEQTTIFNEIGEPIVDNVLAGYNGCLFAYGQTGSGKTWSMSGGSNDPNDPRAGLIPRILQKIAMRVWGDAKEPGWDIQCLVAYMEIYNGQVVDLMTTRVCTLHSLPKSEKCPTGLYIKGLVEIRVQSLEELISLIDRGQKNRKVSGTRMNSESSRSHALLRVTLRSENAATEVKRASELWLVDLAGSEKSKKTEATGDRFKEGVAINTSLTFLGSCIKELAKGKKPQFRDNPLTRLLENALTGNCKTGLVLAASPSRYNMEETLGTMRFGKRAKSITVKVSANTQLSSDKYELIISHLVRAQLQSKAFLAKSMKFLKTKIDSEVFSDARKYDEVSILQAYMKDSEVYAKKCGMSKIWSKAASGGGGSSGIDDEMASSDAAVGSALTSPVPRMRRAATLDHDSDDSGDDDEKIDPSAAMSSADGLASPGVSDGIRSRGSTITMEYGDHALVGRHDSLDGSPDLMMGDGDRYYGSGSAMMTDSRGSSPEFIDDNFEDMIGDVEDVEDLTAAHKIRAAQVELDKQRVSELKRNLKQLSEDRRRRKMASSVRCGQMKAALAALKEAWQNKQSRRGTTIGTVGKRNRTHTVESEDVTFTHGLIEYARSKSRPTTPSRAGGSGSGSGSGPKLGGSPLMSASKSSKSVGVSSIAGSSSSAGSLMAIPDDGELKEPESYEFKGDWSIFTESELSTMRSSVTKEMIRRRFVEEVKLQEVLNARREVDFKGMVLELTDAGQTAHPSNVAREREAIVSGEDEFGEWDTCKLSDRTVITERCASEGMRPETVMSRKSALSLIKEERMTYKSFKQSQKAMEIEMERLCELLDESRYNYRVIRRLAELVIGQAMAMKEAYRKEMMNIAMLERQGKLKKKLNGYMSAESLLEAMAGPFSLGELDEDLTQATEQKTLGELNRALESEGLYGLAADDPGALTPEVEIDDQVFTLEDLDKIDWMTEQIEMGADY